MKPAVKDAIAAAEAAFASREANQRVAFREVECAHRAAMRLMGALKNGKHADVPEPADPIRPRHPEAP